MAEKVHQGKNVRRFREMLRLKQEGLAFELGDDWTQKRVSLLEQKELIDDDILERVAKVLKVPKQAIENMTEDGAINIISNTFSEGAILNAGQSQKAGNDSLYQFNPMDKLIEIHNEKMALYERMLREKDDLISHMQQIIKENR